MRAKSFEFSQTRRQVVRDQRQQAKRKMELYRTENGRIILHERTSFFQRYYPFEMGQLQCQRGQETVDINADVSTLDSLMRTILAVNQFIYHAVSIWYNRVQKSHLASPEGLGFSNRV